MAVWYLDNDDEITDAVARLRDAKDEQVVFVIPPGSRIATGRINLRLLAREAGSRGLRMAIASPDEQVRALAASAGVLGLATADEAEAALERGDSPPDLAAMPETDSASEVTPATAVAATRPRSSRGWSRRRLGIGAVIVLVLAAIGGYAALDSMRTADITLTLRTAAVGPIKVPVTASPDVSESDSERGRIPAVELAIPLSVADTFAASGIDSIETRASGEIVFSSPDQEFDQEIVAGTRVRTPDDVEFQTTAAVILPRAGEAGPSRVTAPIEAVTSGEQGNVKAGKISEVPSLESQGISVSNPKPTTGGRFEQTPVVTASDYDAAAATLQNRLQGELSTYLRDPTNTPESLTLYTGTVQQGPVTIRPPAEEIVGSSVGEFSLSGSVDASVLAVDEHLVEEVTRARLQSAVPEDMTLLDGSLSLDIGEGRADGGRIRYLSTASAVAYPVVDAEEILAQIAGLPVSEARAILDSVGSATVTVWPELPGDLPADHDRIRLDILEPVTTE